MSKSMNCHQQTTQSHKLSFALYTAGTKTLGYVGCDHPSRSFFFTSFLKMADNPATPLTGDPSTHDKTDTLVGSCLCGSITVTITDSELWTKKRGHLCHCSNCRKVAGAPYGSNLIIEEEKVKIVDRDGTRKEFSDSKSFSGKPVKRNFCGVDGKYVIVTFLLTWTAEMLTTFCTVPFVPLRRTCLERLF